LTAASDGGESISSNAPETELRQTLKERHVNMIGFSVVLGVGLFLSTGKCIFISGPGMAVIAYLLMGTLMWYVARALPSPAARLFNIGKLIRCPTGRPWRAWEK